MVDAGTLNLIGGLTIFMVVTVAGRGVLARRGMSMAVAQTVAGLVGIALAVAFILSME
ncbi:hypothetical protein GXW78_07410 [Roseomonas terrae]|jgi:hypothetical protein|uniref:Uncharacterized protein n=1 Tax=Neoroseomonas terrae TaxID=424799 RepID=A0ABS5EEP4_9PROT|nr:hypothetical protein [Neoroseomonas terrae]MBR0649483.1 hypothetical protein [Neoroseomonas terrae]